MKHAPIIAYQLSLFGDKPKPMRAWSPILCVWRIFGEIIAPFPDEIIGLLAQSKNGPA